MTARRFLFLALAAAALKICIGAKVYNPPFDLYIFVREYSPGYCLNRHCSPKPESVFTIHGLWPEFANGSWPSFCTLPGGVPARPAILLGDLAEINCVWPSLSGSNEEFWLHEWNKHGTCAFPLIDNMPQYYNTVLALNRQYNLNKALADAKIIPPNDEPYDLHVITQAVYDAFGVYPLVSCNDGAVVEIWTCLNLALKPIACPTHVRGGPRCSSHVDMPMGDAVSSSCQHFFPQPKEFADNPVIECALLMMAVTIVAGTIVAFYRSRACKNTKLRLGRRGGDEEDDALL